MSNIVLNAGSGGATLGTDADGSSINYQIVKLGVGASGATPTQVSTAAPLPVTLANTGANATAVKVDGSAVTQPVSGTVTANAGTGTFGVSGTVTANLGTIAGAALDTSVNALVVTQGSTTSGQKGHLAQAAVTTAAPTYTTAQTAPLSLDTAGNLRVNVVTGGGSGGTSIADNATFTRGTTSETPVGGIAETSNPTLTTGKAAAFSLDTSGNLRVTVSNGIQAGTAGSANANVLSIQGIASMTPVAVSQGLATSGGASYNNAIAPATPAVTTPKASAGNLYGVVAFNLLATPVYLKFFDAGSVTLGTTAASFQFMVPGNTGGAGFVIQLPVPRSFANAIKYAVTGGIGTTDNTSITANSVIVDVAYN